MCFVCGFKSKSREFSEKHESSICNVNIFDNERACSAPVFNKKPGGNEDGESIDLGLSTIGDE